MDIGELSHSERRQENEAQIEHFNVVLTENAVKTKLDAVSISRYIKDEQQKGCSTVNP